MWAVLWVLTTCLVVLLAGRVVDRGTATTIRTLEQKQALLDGRTSAHTWTLVLDDAGRILHDSHQPQAPGPSAPADVPELARVRNMSLLKPTAGDVVLDNVIYVYASRRDPRAGRTTILLEPYHATGASPWSL